MAKTPCEVPWEGINENGNWTTQYRCPYSDDPTSETCRVCCGEGVDEDDYPEEEEDYE